MMPALTGNESTAPPAVVAPFPKGGLIGPRRTRGYKALGSVAGGVALGQFHLSLGSARDWLRALGGGAIMGIGAVLLPGGNNTMLLAGVPMLLPNLLAAYAAMSLMLGVMSRYAPAPRLAGWLDHVQSRRDDASLSPVRENPAR